MASRFRFRVSAPFFADADRWAGVRDAEAAPPIFPPFRLDALVSGTPRPLPDLFRRRARELMSRIARTTSYDEIPYADDPYPASHPGHLAAVATLCGLSPPPVERCRVLELGCARGGNLIPMAVGLPESRFVGIELSPGQVAGARQVIDALRLENISVENRDILEVDGDLGRFDYIISHGTYSWVPEAVQDKILEISARNLAPNGVAYISYNTHPGWKLRGLVRDLMSYHTRRYERAEDCADQARRVLGFMASFAAPFDRNYAASLKEEVEYLRQRPDSYLLHDHLEHVNDPVYFHQLAGRAAAKGLRYVSEVQNSVLALESFSPQAIDGLRRLSSDQVDFEQFLDFLINRKFRQSVFCHDAMVPRRAPRVEDLARLHVVAMRSVSIPPVQFRNEPLIRGALADLAAIWPRSVPGKTLISRACAGVEPSTPGAPANPPRNEQDLALDLFYCYNLKTVEFLTKPESFVLEISERPLASALARFQVGLGNTVTNLRHESGRLNDFSRFVLRHLDGSHDRLGILRALELSRREGRLDIPRSADDDVERNFDGEGRLEDTFGSMLDRCLESLARFALLMG